MKKLINKIPAILIFSVFTIFTYSLDALYFNQDISFFQTIYSTMCLILSFVLSLAPINDKDKKRFGTWWRVNLISCIFIFLIGLFLMNDILHKPMIYDRYDKSSSILATTPKSIIVKVGDDIVIECDKSQMKYDSLNPLKIYNGYRINILGRKEMPMLFIKSDIMEKYQQISTQ